MLIVFGSHRLMDEYGERSTFVDVRYLHFPETTERAAFLENARRHEHALLIPLI